MYSFNSDTTSHESSAEELQDLVSLQCTAVNELQQQTDSLQRETAALRREADEHRRQIEAMKEQVCLSYHCINYTC